MVANQGFISEIVNELQQTIVELRHQLDHSNHSHHRELNKQNLASESEQCTLKKTIAELRDQLEHEKRENTHIQQQIERQQKANQALIERKEGDFQQHIHQVRHTFEQEVINQTADLKHRIVSLECENDQLKETVKRLRRELESMAKEHA